MSHRHYERHNPSKPYVVAISLNYEPSLEETYAGLFSRLLEKANIQWAKKRASALNLLQQNPPPATVLITDPALTEKFLDVWDAIIAYVRQGVTAIALGHFSSFVKPSNIRPFFAKAGLDWESGADHRTAVMLSPT